mmetsp:Transcript_26482/g.40101  ORF Transcript_26482/g.40101 Transcript_26482/m.40101 type:complete len:93 (-) Transcript_26482:107-385(-)
MSLCAAYLATGHTIQALPISGGSIEQYLLAIAKFIGNFCSHDPHKHAQFDTKISPLIHHIIDEVKRYDKPQNLREPAIIAMITFLKRVAHFC